LGARAFEQHAGAERVVAEAAMKKVANSSAILIQPISKSRQVRPLLSQ
jgi:hypothetical protein